MSNPSTSQITIIDVGTPPASTHNKKWESLQVYFNGFVKLPVTRGVPVYSPEFICFGHRWRVRIFPGGHLPSEEGMVGAYLDNLSNENISLHYCINMIDAAGKVKRQNTRAGAKEFAALGASRPNDGVYDSRGCLWNRTGIIDDLVDGALIIEVRFRQTMETRRACTPFIPDNPTSKAILSKFMDEGSSDIVFEVGDESARNTRKKAKTTTTLYGHRFIMQCATSVLAELCKSGEDTVSVTDVKPEIFRHLLYYIYGGKISEEDMEESAKDIIDAADKYGIVGLKLEAEASLVESTTISFDNAIDNLLYADSKNCALLKEAVMDFIVENGKEATTKLSFEHVPNTVIPDLLTAMTRGKEEANSTSDTNDLSMMRVSSLRKLLHEKGLDIDGSREMMIARIEGSTTS